jgi:hypothetical protein
LASSLVPLLLTALIAFVGQWFGGMSLEWKPAFILNLLFTGGDHVAFRHDLQVPAGR